MSFDDPYKPHHVVGEQTPIHNTTPSLVIAVWLYFGVVAGSWLLYVYRQMTDNCGRTGRASGGHNVDIAGAIVIGIFAMLWCRVRCKVDVVKPIVASVLAAFIVFKIFAPDDVVFPTAATGFQGFIEIGLGGRTAIVAIATLAGSFTMYWTNASVQDELPPSCDDE